MYAHGSSYEKDHVTLFCKQYIEKRSWGIYVHDFVHCEMSHPTHIKNANEIRPLCAPNNLLLQLT